jgi:thiamine-phosphate pyrophosphorylase
MPVFPNPCVAVVTNRSICAVGSLVECITQAIAGGIDLVQLREKDLSTSKLLALALELRSVTEGKALLAVNDRVDIALACHADAIQLGENSMPVAVARRLLGTEYLIGRSVHSLEGAREAEVQGADFLIVGNIFSTDSHAGVRPNGPDLLDQVCQKVRLPVLAIGGVNSSNIDRVMQTGAQGAAVINAILRSRNPREAAESLREAIFSGRKADTVVRRTP